MMTTIKDLSYNCILTSFHKTSNISNNHIVSHYTFIVFHTYHIHHTLDTTFGGLRVLIRI